MRNPKHRHPLVPLVVWLGCCLVACLLALVQVIAQRPSDVQLNNTHLAGMQAGYALCLSWQEDMQATRSKTPSLVSEELQ